MPTTVAASLPLAFDPASLFLLLVVLVVVGGAFVAFSMLGGTLRHERMEAGSEKEFVEGSDGRRRRMRPTHTEVHDPAHAEPVQRERIRPREPRQGPGDH